MPYCQINKLPVFLSHDRYHKLEEIVYENKIAIERVRSAIRGTKECEEKQQLMYGYLKAIYDKNPTAFQGEWVKFKLGGEDASKNVWDLLYDYCHYYGHGYLSDLREFPERLKDDYMGNSYVYPMGKVFVLNYIVRPSKWWWKFTNGMTNRTVSLVVNSENVFLLAGDLKNFKILSKDFFLLCGRNLEILPPSITQDEQTPSDS